MSLRQHQEKVPQPTHLFLIGWVPALAFFVFEGRMFNDDVLTVLVEEPLLKLADDIMQDPFDDHLLARARMLMRGKMLTAALRSEYPMQCRIVEEAASRSSSDAEQ